MTCTQIANNCVNSDQSNVCLNGARCRNLVGSFKCDCPFGFSGTRCESQIDKCLVVNPCKNNAICNGYKLPNTTCTCQTGFTSQTLFKFIMDL